MNRDKNMIKIQESQSQLNTSRHAQNWAVNTSALSVIRYPLSQSQEAIDATNVKTRKLLTIHEGLRSPAPRGGARISECQSHNSRGNMEHPRVHEEDELLQERLRQLKTKGDEEQEEDSFPLQYDIHPPNVLRFFLFLRFVWQSGGGGVCMSLTVWFMQHFVPPNTFFSDLLSDPVHFSFIYIAPNHNSSCLKLLIKNRYPKSFCVKPLILTWKHSEREF